MPETRPHGVADLAEFRERLADLRRNLTPPVSPGEFVASTDGACLGNPDGPGGWAAAIDGPGQSVRPTGNCGDRSARPPTTVPRRWACSARSNGSPPTPDCTCGLIPS